MESAVQEQKEESVATVKEEAISPEKEPDPQEELSKVLAEKKKLEKIKVEMLAKEKAIQQEESELHHKLASGLVDAFMVRLAEFAKEFVTGKVFKDYEAIRNHLQKIQVHDPNFPQSLAQNKYPQVNVKSSEGQFWLQLLNSHVAANQPLHKFLQAVLGKLEGPFVRAEK